MKFRLQYDFSKAQPRWGASLASAFGPRNEGVLIDADTPSNAVESFNAARLIGDQFNPFYIKVTAEQ